jgi:hypothetical protein
MTLKTINIKGKEYVTVNERLKAFREDKKYQGFALVTELVEVNDRTALIRAVIKDDKGYTVASGTAFERADNKKSMVNATSHVENCETSAWGRALGNLGIGIDTSVATADEVRRAEEKPAYDTRPDTRLIMEALTPCKTDKQVETIWKRAMKYDWTDKEMSDLEECKANVLKRIEDERKADVAAHAAELLGSPSA